MCIVIKLKEFQRSIIRLKDKFDKEESQIKVDFIGSVLQE